LQPPCPWRPLSASFHHSANGPAADSQRSVEASFLADLSRPLSGDQHAPLVHPDPAPWPHRRQRRPVCFGRSRPVRAGKTLIAGPAELERQQAAWADPPSPPAWITCFATYVGRPPASIEAERTHATTAPPGRPAPSAEARRLNHTGRPTRSTNALARPCGPAYGQEDGSLLKLAWHTAWATATSTLSLRAELRVYMGAEDMRASALNVFRMRLLGARCSR